MDNEAIYSQYIEQIYNSKNRIYWHGTKSSINSQLAHFNCIYLTLNPKYALSYAKLDNGDGFGNIYQANINKKLNIFNAKSQTDYKLLQNLLIANKKYSIYSVQFERLKSQDWSEIFNGDENRNAVIDMLKSAKYDGWFNYELDEIMKLNGFSRYGMLNVPSIGIFDINNIIFTKNEFKKETWFKDLHSSDIMQLKRNLYIQLKNNNTNLSLYVKSRISDCLNPEYLSLTLTESLYIADNFDMKDADLNNDTLLQEAIHNNGNTKLIYHGTPIKYW